MDIVFIHGLGGDAHETWQSKGGNGWLDWLSEDIAGLRLWTVSWNASATALNKKHVLSISQTSDILLNLLQSAGVGNRPLVFITHSLGGLLLKLLLRDAEILNRPEHQKISRATRSVFFIGTPHKGSFWASPANFAAGSLATDKLKILLEGSPDAISIDRWYDANAGRIGIETNTLYETMKMGVLIVSTASAIKGTEESLAIAVEADHVQICKIPSRLDHSYILIAAKIRLAMIPRSGVPTRIAENIAAFKSAYVFGAHGGEGGRARERQELNTWLDNTKTKNA
jgi:hypothetical protein